MNLSGVFPALTTPFSADGSVSVEDIKHNITKYNTTGLAGYVAIGSTGESVLLSRKEVDTVLVAVKESAAPGMRLIAGTGAESTAETIDRTKRAAELGYHVALVKTPYYYKPMYKPEVFIAHYRRVADASPIPVMLYSVPQFTGSRAGGTGSRGAGAASEYYWHQGELWESSNVPRKCLPPFRHRFSFWSVRRA